MNQENKQFYTVQNGDSISSIALKFNLSRSWIMKTNNLYNDIIFPGDSLLIQPEMKNSTNVIDAVQIFQKDEHKPRKGKINILDDHFRFMPMNSLKSPVSFKLIDLYKTDVKKFNDSDFSDLTIQYIDQKNIMLANATFRGLSNQMEDLNKYISEISSKLKKEENYSLVPRIDKQKKRKRKGRVMSDVTTPTQSPEKRARSISAFLPVNIIGGYSDILDDPMVTSIRGALPMRWRNKNWKLMYQLSKDGCSEFILYSYARTNKPTIFLIETMDKERIGAFLPLGFQKSERYYGSGLMFVFSFNNGFNAYKWSSDCNNYFASSSSSGIMFGGGSSSAIFIDKDLNLGITEPCETFKSPQLASKSSFRVKNIEIFSLE